MTTMIRLKQEGFKPDRDIILALTAGEESGVSNGVEWLIKSGGDGHLLVVAIPMPAISN